MWVADDGSQTRNGWRGSRLRRGSAARPATRGQGAGRRTASVQRRLPRRAALWAEAAGITAGSWYASPASHAGYELIAAGMLILAGGGNGKPLDYDELERWTRVGYERGSAARRGER
jgi:hypothetical protein